MPRPLFCLASRKAALSNATMTAITATAAALSHAAFASSRLVRLLSAGGRAHTPGAPGAADSKPSFAERLGLWLDWTDAIALSAALSDSPAGLPPVQPLRASRAAPAAFEACARVRKELAQLATADVVFAADKAAGGAGAVGASGPSCAADFAAHRRDYLAHQRAMEAAIGPLRAQVRAALTAQSPALARLAALDAVLEVALRPRERHLLATVPQWLETHFMRLHQAQADMHAEQQSDQQAEQQVDSSADLQFTALVRYSQDMQNVLLAELELRLHATEGLLDALRHEPTPST